MVFSSSIPSYQDPHNWQQQPAGGDQISDNNQIPVLSLPPPPGNGTGIGSVVRTGSIAERARIAKLPQPEAALKCPRCDSTNTKFCYFNNYNLSQPRHFCKTCRRYWTRGGALRNVPVGGGCRRNKRSKGISRSKSPAITTDHRQAAAHAVTSSNNCSSSHDMILGHLLPPPQQLPQLHPSLPNISSTGDIGLNFTGFQPSVAAAGGVHGGTNIMAMGYQLGLNSSTAAAAATDHHHQYWRLQQFPFLTGLEPSSGMYPFEGEGTEDVDLSGYSGAAAANGDQLVSKPILDSGVIGQMATAVLKVEDNQGLNLSRNFLGNGSDQYWGTGGGSGASSAWNTSDLSGFTCSSTSHHLL